ncbi:MAG: 2-oxo-4-hydroxy-4-carboxy-5-ureidoimidazoline decarboxylase [Leptolyngbyaceae cyanobacterium CSU_1_4]|nr:2-oxo-4-hydroxy-4-carboxy-5-ureidoimidazoline decarboxylase [Leptolyngbyaceae cyanobacterium CSU_1_4]
MERDKFVAVLGGVFENTPAIAGQAWEQRPFSDTEDLYQCMVKIIHQMTRDEQILFMRSHPDLGSKVRMAEASMKEQSGAGLDRLTLEEYQQFQKLNRLYQARFGFPFIVAVKNHTKASILEAFQTRLANSLEIERSQALTEIMKIVRFRLDEIVD